MATQPFDPKAFESSLKGLGEFSETISRVKTEFNDINKSLTKEEALQRKLNALTNAQSDISSIINDRKKSMVVFDEESFGLEKRKLSLQQELLDSQMKELDAQISGNSLTADQLKAAADYKNQLMAQKIALQGNLKIFEKQKTEGLKIEQAFKAVNDQIKDGKNGLTEVNDKITKIIGSLALASGKEFLKDLNIPTDVESVLKRVYDLYKSIDKAATSVRKTFGLFRSDAEIVETNIREIVIELAEFGVKAEDVQKSISAIGKNFNYVNTLDKSIVKDISMMSRQMGISEEKSAKFLKTIGGIKGESGVANKSMLSFAGSVANAYGIGLDEVMTDVAEAGDDVRAYAGKTAEQLIMGPYRDKWAQL